MVTLLKPVFPHRHGPSAGGRLFGSGCGTPQDRGRLLPISSAGCWPVCSGGGCSQWNGQSNTNTALPMSTPFAAVWDANVGPHAAHTLPRITCPTLAISDHPQGCTAGGHYAEITVASPTACCDSCALNASCFAWTFHPAGGATAGGQCDMSSNPKVPCKPLGCSRNLIWRLHTLVRAVCVFFGMQRLI